MADEALLCSFQLADHRFAVNVAVVREVLRQQEITRLPLARPAVRGVINLRGRIVPAVDLRRCIGMEPAPPDREQSNIVVQPAGMAAVSLLVDEIGDVIEVQAAAFEETPQTLRGMARELIRGVYRLQDEVLLVLDIGKVLRTAYA